MWGGGWGRYAAFSFPCSADHERDWPPCNALVLFFPSPPIRSGEVFSSVIFSSLSLFLFVFFGGSDGMEREACVCDHGFERSDLCAEIIII